MAIVPHGGGVGGSASMAMPMLTQDNYTVWAIKAQAILDGHTAWEAVAPGDAAVNARKDKTARALLLGALPEDVLLSVATKPTAREVWDSLKVRFVGADRVRAARLATLRGEFDRLKMANGEVLDAYAGRLVGMTARYANLGETLGDTPLVKKLLDTVPDRLFPVVVGIEQFCDVTTMAFDEALGRLRAFDERVRRHGQDSGDHGRDQLMLTMAQWRAGERQRNRRGRCYKCGERGHFKRDCPKLRREPAAERALLADVVEWTRNKCSLNYLRVAGAGLAGGSTVALHFGPCSLFIAKPGDERWTPLPLDHRNNKAIIATLSFDGRFYCVTEKALMLVDATADQPPRLVAVVARLSNWDFKRYDWSMNLVDKDGELALVHRAGRGGYEVHQVDPEAGITLPMRFF
ncbi:uncharacterized protein [Aegilops tauschii subsp. strangulata]|uniref:uncharacterized protein n=1 Tax=Aegilops tauschii subsp. strangulata TaxID=200361 RepID=UPI003CC84DEB